MSHVSFTLEGGKEVTLDVKVTATCPFCRHERKYIVGYAAGSVETGVPMVIHAEPRCPEFDQLDCLTFLKKARHAGARTVPEPS